MLVAAFYQREGRDGVAVVALCLGTLLVLAGTLHHRGFRGKVGAAGGVEIDAVSFAVDQGAVGRAWSEERYVVAHGAAVSDGTFGLSPEQQQRYADLAVVAAVPVANASGQPIAVLSASSKEPGTKLTSPEGFRYHLFLADLVARVLVDLLKWSDDGYDATTEEA